MAIILIQTRFYSIVSLETHIIIRFDETVFSHMFPSKHSVIFRILFFVLPMFASFALSSITHGHNICSDSFLLTSVSCNTHYYKICSDWSDWFPHTFPPSKHLVIFKIQLFVLQDVCKFCPFPYNTRSQYLFRHKVAFSKFLHNIKQHFGNLFEIYKHRMIFFPEFRICHG